MPMTLTQWWQVLSDDLKRLKPLVKNGESAPWLAAETMAKEGAQIEDGLLTAMGHKNEIDKAIEKLGPEFTTPKSKEKQYLPKVSSPDELLFAVVYYQHLDRYKTIDTARSGSPTDLILAGVIKERPVVQDNVDELKKRIDAYCSQPGIDKAIIDAFPDLANQNGQTLPDKVASMLAELPLDEKLIGQFEAEANDLLQTHGEKDDKAIINLFNQLDSSLQRKENALREIASFKKYRDELASGSLTLADIKDETVMQKKFPNHYKQLMELDSADTERSSATKGIVNAARTAIAAVETSFSLLVNPFVRYTIGYVTPQFINTAATTVVNSVSGVTNSFRPTSNDDSKKQALVAKAEEKISTLVKQLNYKDSEQISAKDFAKMSSDQINTVAEKVAIVRHMVDIQKCLEQYHQKQTTGIVEVTQAFLIKPFVKWLSESPLRRVIHDRVLLTFEAENLKNQLDGLIAETNENPDVDLDQIKQQLTSELDGTKQKADQIHKNSIYTLFEKDRKENKEAKDELDTFLETSSTRARGPSG